jgi:hypothetical protein
MGFLWVLMLYTASEVFPRLPPAVASAENWRQRLSYRLRRGMMWLLAVLFLSLTVSLILLSYQLLRVSFM